MCKIEKVHQSSLSKGLVLFHEDGEAKHSG